MKKARMLIIAGFAVLMAMPAMAKPKTADVVNFNPTSDGGKYITLHQSKSLHQWGFNVGMYTDYAYHPLEYADPSGNRRRGIVDSLLMSHFDAAIGFFDFWSMGIDMPMAWWEVFYNPAASAAAVQKENVKMKMGDLRVEMKFKFLDIDKYHFGLALVPFMYFPTGNSSHFLGNGMWSPGGKLVVDGDIKNRVFLSFNAGYRAYNRTQYDPNTTDATINDTIELGLGVNVRINDSWAVLGEVYSESVLSAFFKNQLQNPAEFTVAGRWTPQSKAKGLGVTLGGGRGLDTGIGSPDFRVFAGVNYRPPKKPPAPVPVEVVAEEKIVITQKIHFEFNKSTIRSISYPILDDVAYLLQINPQIRRVRVEGHTDWIGSDAYNQKLSERRAASVRDYLIGKGIASDRLIAIGYGEARPIADNNTTQGRARNRRTEFTVLE